MDMSVRSHTYKQTHTQIDSHFNIYRTIVTGRKAWRDPSDQCVSRFRAEKTKKLTYKFSTLLYFFLSYFISFLSSVSTFLAHLLRTLFDQVKRIASQIQNSSNREIDQFHPSVNRSLSPPSTLLYFIMTLLIKISLMCLIIYAATAVPIDEAQNKPRISEEELDMALKDNRYIKKQLTCALHNIKCDSVGRRLKSLAPLVLRGNCPQCSPDETVYIKKVLLHVQSQFPQEWSKLLEKYSKF